MNKKILKEFQVIPGVGPAIAEDLWNLGFRSIDEFKKKDPEELYEQLCDLEQTKVCRCMLYVLRLVVYYASNDSHDPYLLKWHNWKD